MTTAATGTASLRPVIGTTITIPSRITTSIQNLDSLTAAQLVTPSPPESPSVLVEGAVTTVPDNPGFTALPVKQPSSAAQMDAIRSAAANTATAYGLDETFSADTASIEQLTIQQQIARLQPTIVITQIIIPP